MITFPARISINAPIEGALLDYTYRQNGKIVKAGFRDIDFSSLKQRPHVTLLMGDVLSESDLRKLQDILAEFSKNHCSFQFKVSAPYLANPGNRFCFLGITDSNEFSRLKHALANSIEGLMRLDFHGGPENPPHVTLGYFNLQQMNIEKYGFETFVGDAEIKHLGISTVGNRGSCIEYFNVYELS